MHSWRRKYLSWFLVSVMLTALLPGASLASDQSSISMDQAIQTVKQTFTVPPAYTSFSSGYNKEQNSQSWSLNWNDPAGNGGNFSAQVDAVSGEIISMNCWRPETQPHSRIPSISLSDAQKMGSELLQRLIPSRFSSLMLIPDNQLVSLTSFGSSNYSIRWQRMYNNIPVIGEGANMEISANDGQVLNYNLNWTNLDMPSPTGVISPAVARQSFISEGIIQLEYVLPYRSGPLVVQAQQTPMLAYRLDHPSQGILDAFSGKPFVPANDHWLGGGGGGFEAMSMTSKNMAMDQAAQPLTPQEQAEIEQTSNLLSQEEAASIIAKWIDIPNNLSLRSANLEQDWRDPQLRIWNLNWSSSRSSNSKQSSHLYGRVNALTGELVGFNLNLPSSDSKSATMTQEAAQTLADSFLKKLSEQRFSQLKLDQARSDQYNQRYISSGVNQSSWHFNYLRTVNGISFPANGANIIVDRASQKITSYNLNWIDKEFPSAQGVLGIDRANDLYLQAAPLTLSYSILYNGGGGLSEMHLIYQPQNQSGQAYFSMIDAHSGEKLDEQGKPVSQNEGVHVFNDIAGNFAEKEISILGQAGLMGEYGDSFHPDENISLLVLLRTMLNSASGIDNTRDLSDSEVMKRAFELGWIKENLAPESEVNRALLSQLIVRSLDLEYLARRPEIYQLPYQDAYLLGDDLKGYAALSFGLDIIKGDGINFDAGHLVSRAEAAFALVRSLGAKT